MSGESNGYATFNFSGGTLRPCDNNATFGSATAANNYVTTLSGTAATITSSDATGTARTVNVYTTLTGARRLDLRRQWHDQRLHGIPYTGPTAIASGTLNISGTGTTLSTSGISNNGTLGFNSPAAVSYSGPITGPGSVVLSGTGPVTLAPNTYTGGTTVNAGALQLNSGSVPASGLITINSPGPLIAAGLHVRHELARLRRDQHGLNRRHRADGRRLREH